MAEENPVRPSYRCRDEWISGFKDKGITIEAGHFPARSGGLTAFTFFRSKAEAPLTLLVHGTGNDHLFTFQAMIEALIAKGQNVVSFDLLGHGEGSSTELAESSFWESQADIESFLKFRALDKQPLNAIAYSLGGLFLLNALDNGTLKLQKIVLLAVPIRAKLSLSFFVHELRTIFSKTFYQQGFTYGWSEAIPAFGAFRREDFPLRLPETYRKSYPEFVDELLQKKPPLSLLKNLGQNCLVVFGARDKLASPDHARLWRDANEHLTFVTVDKANHFLLPFYKPTIDLVTQWITT